MARVPVASPIRVPRVADAPLIPAVNTGAGVAFHFGDKLEDAGEKLQDAEDVSRSAEALGLIQRDITDLEFKIKEGNGDNAGELFDSQANDIFTKHSKGLTKGALTKLGPRYNTFSQSTRLRVRNFARQRTIDRGKAGVINAFEVTKQHVIDLYASGDLENAELILGNSRVVLEQSKNAGFFKPEDADKYYRTFRDEVRKGAILKGSREGGYKRMISLYSRGNFKGAPHLAKLYNSFTPEEQQDIRDTIGKEAWRVHQQQTAMRTAAEKAQQAKIDEENDSFMRKATEFPDAASARVWLSGARQNNRIEAKTVAWVESYLETFDNRHDQAIFRSQAEQVISGNISSPQQLSTIGLDRTSYMSLLRLMSDMKESKSYFNSEAYEQAQKMMDNDARLIPRGSLVAFIERGNKQEAIRHNRIIRLRIQQAALDAVRNNRVPQDPFKPNPGEFDVFRELDLQMQRLDTEIKTFETLKSNKKKADSTIVNLKTALQKDISKRTSGAYKGWSDQKLKAEILSHEQSSTSLGFSIKRFESIGYGK